jgi:hypothetical protein
MSIRGTIFKKLADHLMASLNFPPSNPEADPDPNPFDLPAVKWVDLNRGQFKNMSSFTAIPLPAILIKFRTADWVSMGQNVQDGSQIIEFEIGYENYSSSYQGSVDQAEALKYLEFQEEVYKVLTGYQDENFSALQRVADDGDDDDQPGALIATRIAFHTIVTDDSATTGRNNVIVTGIETKTQYTKTLPENQNEINKGFIIPPNQS